MGSVQSETHRERTSDETAVPCSSSSLSCTLNSSPIQPGSLFMDSNKGALGVLSTCYLRDDLNRLFQFAHLQSIPSPFHAGDGLLNHAASGTHCITSNLPARRPSTPDSPGKSFPRLCSLLGFPTLLMDSNVKPAALTFRGDCHLTLYQPTRPTLDIFTWPCPHPTPHPDGELVSHPRTAFIVSCLSEPPASSDGSLTICAPRSHQR